MPIHISASLTAADPDSPTVTGDFVVHFPEEIVTAAVRADQLGQTLVVACRERSQAELLAGQLLAAEVGSGVITGRTNSFDLQQTLEAFGYGDFTVLLVTDDIMIGWQAPTSCTRLLHADLPAAPGSRQFFSALRHRLERLSPTDQVTQVA